MSGDEKPVARSGLPIPWEALTAGVAFVALVLPAAGAISTAVSFSLAGIPPQVAVARPIGALAIDGVRAVLLPTLFTAGYAVVLSRWGRWVRTARTGDVRPRSRFAVPIVLGAAVVGLAWLVLSAPFVVLLVGVPTALALAAWTSVADRPGGVTFVRAVPIATAVALVTAIGAGISPQASAVVGEVRFANPALTDGLYSFVGAENGVVYLVPCTGNTHLLRVGEDLIVSIQLADRIAVPAPTIVQLVNGASLRFGFVPGCP